MIVGRWYVQNVVHDTGICHDVSIISLNVLLFFAIILFKLTNSGTEKLNGKATIPACLILIRFSLFVCLFVNNGNIEGTNSSKMGVRCFVFARFVFCNWASILVLFDCILQEG